MEHKSGRTRISGEQEDGKVAPVVNDDDGAVFCDVTSDGKTFTWTSHPGDYDVLKTFTTGGDVAVTAEAPKTDYCWSQMSADGSKLVWTAFDRNGDPSNPDVAVMYRDGQNEYVMQAKEGPVFPAMPQVSDDGSTIAWFTVDGSKPGAVTQVFVYEKGDAQPAPPSQAPQRA